MPSNYRESGVDIDAANETVHRIRALARRTFGPAVLSDIGSFGGLFRFEGMSRGPEPVLVASADGVGTKLKVAIMVGSHRTVGVDLVNHCVNDILVQGAEPLFFLDYYATGALDVDAAAQVVEGIARACKASGCALIGGETAEMPGLYAKGDFDLAGFAVGAVERVFRPHFRARRRLGLPWLLPPQYLDGLARRAPGLFRRLARWDRRLAHHWPCYALGDHFLLEFVRTRDDRRQTTDDGQ